MRSADEDYLMVARDAARLAGKLQLVGLRSQRSITHKGPFDLVTDVDRQCEQAIYQILREAFPESGFYGEETTRTGLDADEVWIVDPLDGTTNYTHGYPHFSVSIALKRQGRVVLGVVFDPSRDELFEAVRGHGALRNGSPIQVSALLESLGGSPLYPIVPSDEAAMP